MRLLLPPAASFSLPSDTPSLVDTLDRCSQLCSQELISFFKKCKSTVPFYSSVLGLLSYYLQDKGPLVHNGSAQRSPAAEQKASETSQQPNSKATSDRCNHKPQSRDRDSHCHTTRFHPSETCWEEIRIFRRQQKRQGRTATSTSTSGDTWAPVQLQKKEEQLRKDPTQSLPFLRSFPEPPGYREACAFPATPPRVFWEHSAEGN